GPSPSQGPQEEDQNAGAAVAQDALGTDAAIALGPDPLVPRAAIRLRRRRRIPDPRLGPVRRPTTTSQPDPGEPVLRPRAAARPAAGGRGQEAQPSTPQEGGEAADSRGGGDRNRAAETAGGVLVRRWPSYSRGGQRDGPLAQVGGGSGRGVVGVRARPDRDPP